MIHMGFDHRCVMTIFTIIMSEKSSHRKTKKGKHDTIKDEGRDQTGKTLKFRSLSSKKTYQEIIETKNRHKKTAATSRKRKCSSASRKRKCQKQKQKMKIPKRKREEADGTFTEIMVSNDVEAAGETGGGNLGQRTANEETGHIVLRVGTCRTRHERRHGRENDD